MLQTIIRYRYIYFLNIIKKCMTISFDGTLKVLTADDFNLRFENALTFTDRKDFQFWIFLAFFVELFVLQKVCQQSSGY